MTSINNKKVMVEFLKDRKAKLTIKKDWLHAEFPNARHCELVVEALHKRFGYFHVDRAYETAIVRFYK